MDEYENKKKLLSKRRIYLAFIGLDIVFAAYLIYQVICVFTN